MKMSIPSFSCLCCFSRQEFQSLHQYLTSNAIWNVVFLKQSKSQGLKQNDNVVLLHSINEVGLFTYLRHQHVVDEFHLEGSSPLGNPGK